MRELYNIFSTSLLTIISLLVIRVADAEPCQGSVRNDAYSGIYTCWDPTVVLVDPTIQCDPDTCLWDLDALDPANPPGPCEAVRLVEEQLSNLSDLLEPCLWWEMLYGDLGHLLPEQTDAPVAMPSQSPVIAASLAPSSFVESGSPTADNSSTPSSSLLETSLPAPSSVTLSPTAAPSTFTAADVTSSPTRVGRLSVSLQSMLLTFVFERFSGFRLRNRHLRETGLLATAQSYDAMIAVTKAHIVANIPQLVDADLVMSRVNNDDKSSNDKMETIVLMGSLYFAVEPAASIDTLPDLRPATVRRQVEDVFENNVSVLRYIHSLRETGQDAFQDIVLVYPGIVAPDSQNQRPASDEEESFWESFFLNWENPIWIVVAAGISAAALGLCLVFSATCFLRMRRRRGAFHRQLASRKSDDTSRTAAERNQNNVQDSAHDDEISANDPTDISEIGYQESEVTSVYSYLENNNTMLDDQSYSVAPSFMYPGAEYDDEQRSVLWSVIDDAKDNDLADVLSTMSGIDPPANYKTESPSRKVVSATKEQPSEDVEDDAYSLSSQHKGQPQPLDFTNIRKGGSPSDSPTKSGTSAHLHRSALSMPKTSALDDIASKSSSDSISGATQSSRESSSKFSKMIPGFRSKFSKVKPSSTYQNLDESDASHHSWDKELGISPSPDDLDDDSVFLDDSASDNTGLSQLAPLSSINRISSGGDNDDSDQPMNETTGGRGDDDSVESGDSQEDAVEPAQFVIPVSDSAELGYLGTSSEDTNHSDGKDSKSSEKENNISSDALLDGISNDCEGVNSAAEFTEQHDESPDQNRCDATSGLPLAEKPDSARNNNSDKEDISSVTDAVLKDNHDIHQSSKKETGNVDNAPESNSHNIPTSEQDLPPIHNMASF